MSHLAVLCSELQIFDPVKCFVHSDIGIQITTKTWWRTMLPWICYSCRYFLCLLFS